MKKVQKSINQTKKYPQFLILGVILLIFLISFFLSFSEKSTRTFIFPSADEGKFVVEYRNLSKKSFRKPEELFIDEILLGSTLERTKKLFTLGTKLNSCFKRDDVLYVDLSKELFLMGNDILSIKNGIKLLEKNILRNFHNIKKIEFFIDGKLAFEK